MSASGWAATTGLAGLFRIGEPEAVCRRSWMAISLVLLLPAVWARMKTAVADAEYILWTEAGIRAQCGCLRSWSASP